MIVKDYIKKFESYGFGMFVHFGLYSVIGMGEWVYNQRGLDMGEYEKLTDVFCPDEDWAEKLVKTAKAAGCKYITLTTRHHEGFSLYDNAPLNEFDAPHSAAKRDLVREFVDACNSEGIAPFFYHTLLDWHEKSFYEDFKTYLKYLRDSIEILCTRYGKVGGFWFDGTWSKPKDTDWEFDELYGLIRHYQPDAMIINNTGLHARGQAGHEEIDSLTFERGRPQKINTEGAKKYLASEMCQVFGDHWGYAELDYNFKSLAEIIGDYCTCRRCGSNFLLNVGPMGNGKLRTLDTAMLLTLGDWINRFSEALVGTVPMGIEVEGRPDDFVMKGNGAYYLFCSGLQMGGSDDVVAGEGAEPFTSKFNFDCKIKSINWLESGDAVTFSQSGNNVTVRLEPQPYGQSVVVRIAKIEVE